MARIRMATRVGNAKSRSTLGHTASCCKGDTPAHTGAAALQEGAKRRGANGGALTQPVWEDGIPPDPISRVQSQRRSLYQKVKAFNVCAITNAITAAMNGLRGKPRL